MANDHKNSPAPAPTPAPTAAPAAPAAKVRTVRVKSLVGDMLHLFQNVMITEDSKKIDLDGFTQAQIDAGKWAIDSE